MKILMASTYPRDPSKINGGVDAVVVNLTNELARFPDLKVQIVSLDQDTNKYYTRKHNGLDIHYLPYSKIPSRISAVHNRLNIKKLIKKLKPDLVHAQVAGVYALAASESGLPWVMTLHGIRYLEAELWKGLINRFYRRWFIKRIELNAIQRAKNIISISPFIRETFGNLITGNVWSIENPISNRFFEIDQKGVEGHILFVGRLIVRKGIHTMLQAFENVYRKYPFVKLHVVGGGISRNDSSSYVDDLVKYVAEKHLSEAVVFRGELKEKDIVEEYKKCSVFVLSSILETAPMVTMQAMAAGKPVVSTDTGGSRHLVAHGRSGILVPKNDPRALADAIIKIVSNREMASKMGANGRLIALERFHAKSIAKATRGVYCQMLSGRMQ